MYICVISVKSSSLRVAFRLQWHKRCISVFTDLPFKTNHFTHGKRRWLVIASSFNGKFVAANSQLGKGNSVFVPGKVLLILEFPFEHPIVSQLVPCTTVLSSWCIQLSKPHWNKMVTYSYHYWSHSHLRCQVARLNL